MSWTNVAPWWVILLHEEETYAYSWCAFKEEYNAGVSRELPHYIADPIFEHWNSDDN